MLDIKFIRENLELVQEKATQKGYDVDVKKLLKLDDERKDLARAFDEKRRQINEHAAMFQETKGTTSQENIDKGKALKKELSGITKQLEEIDAGFMLLLKAVPNMPADDVPVGKSETDNVVDKEWGKKPKFDFEPKSHWQLAEARGWIDKERAAKVAGSRFAYIKGDLVKLQFAIIQFTIDNLTDKKVLKEIATQNKLDVSDNPFIPVLPPFMLRTEVYDAMDRLEPREERYRVGEEKDDLWLEGSAEHTLGPMYLGETLDEVDLPFRYLGYATSFRREAGSYGKDTEGIIRMHQFDKLEMESFTFRDDGLNEHLFMIAIQEYLMQQLGIPYQVLLKCTADIGKPNARGVDIEAWLPGQNKYLETHTADYMTDYQARRLDIRTKVLKSSEPGFNAELISLAHTNDATAFALGRTMVAIIENHQDEQGKVHIPKALQPYMHGQTEI